MSNKQRKRMVSIVAGLLALLIIVPIVAEIIGGLAQILEAADGA